MVGGAAVDDVDDDELVEVDEVGLTDELDVELVEVEVVELDDVVLVPPAAHALGGGAFFRLSCRASFRSVLPPNVAQ